MLLNMNDNKVNVKTDLCFEWGSPRRQVVQTDSEICAEQQVTAAQLQTSAAKIQHLCSHQRTAGVTRPACKQVSENVYM